MTDRRRPTAIVEALSIRPYKDQLPRQATELILQNQFGIFGDCHASPISPRQVLIAFKSDYRDFNLPTGSLKENILLDTSFSPEEIQSGDCLSLDSAEITLRLTFKCEPCGRLNKVQPNLSHNIRGRRGYLARVINGGLLRAGDTLRLHKSVYPPFSDDWHERVIRVAQLLPVDRSLSFATLALLAGVASTYCRAFPRLLQKHDLPNERIFPSSISPAAPFPEWNGESLFSPETISSL